MNPRLIAIASGKGGVGKTWVAITLAHALARAGRRVLLFDGDLGLANVDIQLGLAPARDLATALAGGEGALSAAAAYSAGGFDVVAGRSGTEALANLAPTALEQVIADLRGATARYDAVLIDLGAGIDVAVRRMAACADLLLVIATDEPTSLTDAYAVLKLHAADRGTAGQPCADGTEPAPCRIVINQAATTAAGERSYATLARACAAFLGATPPLAGIIRRDDRVREAIRRQTLFLTRSPTCPAAVDIEALAAALHHPARQRQPSLSAPA